MGKSERMRTFRKPRRKLDYRVRRVLKKCKAESVLRFVKLRLEASDEGCSVFSFVYVFHCYTYINLTRPTPLPHNSPSEQ